MNWLFTRSLRPFVLLAGLTSLALNLTLLIPPLFMLQVFDRVFSSRSMETLYMLALAALTGLLLMYAMDVLRTLALAWAGKVLDKRLGIHTIQGLIRDSASLGGPRNQHSVRDAGLLRAFLTGHGIFALFDAPWLPLYLIVIFLFHPILGVTASLGAMALFLLALLNERLTRQPTETALLASRIASRYIDSASRNAEAIMGMGMDQGVATRWSRLNEDVQEAQGKLTKVNAFLGAMVRLVRQSMQVVMLCIGAWLTIRQHVTGCPVGDSG